MMFCFPQIATLLKEDYERLSKIFIFIEEASKRRSSLAGLNDKMLEILCKMAAMGTPVTSQLSRDLALDISDLSLATQDEHDYVLLKDTHSVIDSLKVEYKALKAIP